MVREGISLRHAGLASYTLEQSAVPRGITSALNRSWIAHHGRLDLLDLGRHSARQFAAIPVDLALSLRLDWLQ